MKLNNQNNLYSENTQAVLLLSTFFSKPKKGESRPLTAIEYGRFARWLHEFNYTPGSLFHQFDEIVTKWKDPKGKIVADTNETKRRAIFPYCSIKEIIQGEYLIAKNAPWSYQQKSPRGI